MKKISIICLTVVLCLCCFTACSNGANRFYNSKVLKEFQITDFPKPQGVEDFEATNSRLSFNTTAEGFEDYAEQIYTYLVEKDFKYFGYRGDVISTFFGGAPEYEFYISSEFSEHQCLVDNNGKEYENRYIFVFSNKLSESNGLLNKCEIEVRYHPDNEEYNSCVLISYTNNARFSYTLITDKNLCGHTNSIQKADADVFDSGVFYAGYYLPDSLVENSLNYDKLANSRLDRALIYKFDTYDEYTAFKTQYEDNLSFELLSYITNDYFEEHTLVLAYEIVTNSTYRYMVSGIYIEEEKICVHVKETTKAENVDNAMCGWFFAVTIKKTITDDITTYDAIIEE